MKAVTLRQLLVGMTVRMKVGSPVRQWMRRLGDGRRWLTPVHYILLSDDCAGTREQAAVRQGEDRQGHAALRNCVSP